MHVEGCLDLNRYAAAEAFTLFVGRSGAVQRGTVAAVAVTVAAVAAIVVAAFGTYQTSSASSHIKIELRCLFDGRRLYRTGESDCRSDSCILEEHSSRRSDVYSVGRW